MSLLQSQAAKKAGPTVIIFIVGGMTFSEMRTIYEVSKATSDCEVIIGEPVFNPFNTLVCL